jgi:hypothetical protein
VQGAMVEPDWLDKLRGREFHSQYEQDDAG